jgi:HSP20 family protein
MPKKEKSFFGKIMGGDVASDPDEDLIETPGEMDDELDDSEELVEVDEEEFVEEDDDAEEGQAEEEESGEEEADEEEEEEDTAEIEPAPQGDQREEDWMSDYEGALNIDMYQTKDNVIIKSTIAGVRPEDIDITVANDMVTIKGERVKEEKIAQEDYFYQECYWGGFSRSVIVPVDIDSEETEADYKDGILTIIIPKAAKAKTKKVKVKGL